jgi:hypothetical protein
MTQLELDTAAYYQNMSEEEAKAERELENAITGTVPGIFVDGKEQQESGDAGFQISVTDRSVKSISSCYRSGVSYQRIFFQFSS